jgi:putative ABC transport system permease protein
MRVAAALYRALLRAYPRDLRARVGRDLTLLFIARLEAARQRGSLPGFLLAAWLLCDVVVAGLTARARHAWHRWCWPRQIDSPHPSWSLQMSLRAIARDARLAVRQLGQSRAFTMLTVATLALGIGANAAIFSAVRAVILRPLPYASPARLTAIWSDNTRQHDPQNPVSAANFYAVRSGARSFERVEAMFSFLVPVQVRYGDDVDLVQASTVTTGMLDLLGRAPIAGRTFRDGDANVVVLSYGYWMRRFGGDRGVVGRTVGTVAGAPPTEIVGVMPEDFVFPYTSMLGPSGFTRATATDVWLPLNERAPQMIDAAHQPVRTIHFLSVIGRLAPDATVDAAQHELDALAARRMTAFPDTNDGWGFTVRPLHDQTIGTVRPALLVLLGGVGIVLLMTCLNVANVMLARGGSRRRELAIRTALGASRVRLVAQTIVESLVLAIAGGAAGLVVCALATRVLVAAAPGDLPRLAEIAIDPAVLAFTALVSLGTGLFVGVLPALIAAQHGSTTALRETTRTIGTPARRRVRAALVVAQVTLATALAVGAGLLVRSFVAVLHVDPGFAPDRLLTFQMNVPPHLTTVAARASYYADLGARLAALPGVTHVGGTTRLPLGSTNVSTQVDVEGRDVPPAERPEVELRRAVFDYFGAMRIPIVAGRDFNAADALPAPPVAIVNQALAARVFGGEDPVGRRVRLGAGSAGPYLTIVGVVGNVQHGSLEERPRPEIYLSYLQNFPVSPFIVLRTTADPAALGSAVRGAVTATGANPPFDVRTMPSLLAESMAKRRFLLMLVGAFGVLALALAAIGVYGVTALVVAERTREVGVRLALGERPGQVCRRIVGDALRLGVTGAAAGLVLGVGLSTLAAGQLFRVAPIDPPTLIGVSVLLLLAATAAALGPGRRAMRVDPISVLRD